jgi:hypothetical protein
MQFGTDWATLKSFVQARGLSIQYITTPDTYYLWAIDGTAEVYSQISIVSPTPSGSDQADFETNFMPAGNSSPRGNVVQVLGKDSLVLCPFGVSFNAPASQTTTYSYALTSAVYLRGGILFASPGTLGDQLTVQIVDVNNILGAGANYVVATYVNGWYVMPGIPNQIEDVSVSSEIPAGLYVNFLYTNVSSTQATQVIVNFLSYQGSI